MKIKATIIISLTKNKYLFSRYAVWEPVTEVYH